MTHYKIYYEVRTVGDGDSEWFAPTINDLDGPSYNRYNLDSCRRFRESLINNEHFAPESVWIVKITEELIE